MVKVWEETLWANSPNWKFPGTRCLADTADKIVRTAGGQVAHIIAKGRVVGSTLFGRNNVPIGIHYAISRCGSADIGFTSESVFLLQDGFGVKRHISGSTPFNKHDEKENDRSGKISHGQYGMMPNCVNESKPGGPVKEGLSFSQLRTFR